MKSLWVAFALMLAGALAIFHVFQSTISDGLLNLALEPTLEILDQAMADQRTLSALDPVQTEVYRARFEAIRRQRNNYMILEHNREEIVAKLELILGGFLTAIVVFTSLFYIWRAGRQRRRLSILQEHLEALAAGQIGMTVPDRGRDILGRIARMIEKAGGVMAVQRRRLNNLESLSNWQEAARRHAHEIRTPLTAAQMELNLMVRFVGKRAPELNERCQELQSSVLEELDRLKEFTHAFTSFAKIGKPKLQDVNVHAMTAKFCELFAEAWPNMSLQLDGCDEGLQVTMDKDMVRQVLVNLCNNSSLALAEGKGQMCLRIFSQEQGIVIEARDNGPGIPDELRAGVFKPYTTSRKIGEGMGLGLAIAKKIMLDHGGDLVLDQTSAAGTSFHLVFAAQTEDVSDDQDFGG